MPRLSPVLVGAIVALGCTTVDAEVIDITDPGFESPLYSPCFFGPTSYWQNGNSWRCGTGSECAPFNGFPLGPPEGLQVGYVDTGFPSMFQVLDAVLEPNRDYVLSVHVGRRSDHICCVMEDYSVQLRAGGLVLAEDPGLLDPSPGTFLMSTVSYSSPASHPAMGQPLEIRLTLVAGGQGHFDDVRLVVDEGNVPGDITGDGAVNISDLLAILSSWGPCPGCPADLNGDGVVNVQDLLIVLGNWSG